MSTTVSRPLTEAEQIFKELVWDPMLKAGESWLELEVPALALPVVKQIDESAIQAITDWAYSQLCLLVDVTAIRFIDSAHQSAYDKASEELKIVALEKGVNSDAFKTARDQALADLARFAHLNA